MNEKQYFHLCSSGRESRNFITNELDFIAAMNILAVAAANCDVIVISFSIQDTHYHILLFGELSECAKFKELFEKTYRHYVSSSRRDTENAVPGGELYPIGNDLDYLRNVAAYTIIQPTKDGKRVMPFDYRWGSGSLYFRPPCPVHLWSYDKACNYVPEIRFKELSGTRKREILHSRSLTIPDSWKLCGDIILPQNYIDIPRFESIFQTHNCYRVFLSGSRKKEEDILMRIANERGIVLEDTEARQKCTEACLELFNIKNQRLLEPKQRLQLAHHLRRKYRITFRQLSTLLRLPENEIRRFLP
ncbi:MAG: hypothetical protein J5699_01300 [Bacteroidales bacterium]|nr:hypothetical protein [Bacteroidales bacterium]